MASGTINGRHEVNLLNVSEKIEESHFIVDGNTVSLFLLGKANKSFTNGEKLCDIPSGFIPISNFLTQVFTSGGAVSSNVVWINSTGAVYSYGTHSFSNSTRMISSSTYIV